jgi:hypothetical protein
MGGAFGGSVGGMSTDLNVFRQEVTANTEVSAQLDLSTDELNITDVSTPEIAINQYVPVISPAHFTSQIPTYTSEGCGVTTTDLVVVPPPQFDLVAPRIMCAGSTQTMFVQGRFFVFITGGNATAMSTAAAATSATSAAASTAPATTVAAPHKRHVLGTSSMAPAGTTTTTSAAGVTSTSGMAAAVTTTLVATTVGAVMHTTSSAAATGTQASGMVTLADSNSSVTAMVQPVITVGDFNASTVTGNVCGGTNATSALQVCEQIQFDVRSVVVVGHLVDACSSCATGDRR